MVMKLLEPKVAIQNRTRPSILAPFTAKPAPPGTSIEGVTKGAYILADSEGTPDLILIGTGMKPNSQGS